MIGAGQPVALPTETVYGLAADATNAAAVARVYAAKGRPAFNPLIIHVPDLAAAERIAVLDGPAGALAARHWPGPLTLVLPARDGSPVVSLATAGLPTVAVRVPAHPVMRAVPQRVHSHEPRRQRHEGERHARHRPAQGVQNRRRLRLIWDETDLAER